MTDSTTDQLPVWTIVAPNWQANVAMDEFNAQFPIDIQLYEAASQVVEHIKGLKPTLDNNITLTMDDGEEKPSLAPIMFAFPLNGDPNKNVMLFGHIILGNCGLYNDSMEMFFIMNKEADEFLQENPEHKDAFIKELKNFNKKPRNKRKKKNPPSKE